MQVFQIDGFKFNIDFKALASLRIMKQLHQILSVFISEVAARRIDIAAAGASAIQFTAALIAELGTLWIVDFTFRAFDHVYPF